MIGSVSAGSECLACDRQEVCPYNDQQDYRCVIHRYLRFLSMINPSFTGHFMIYCCNINITIPWPVKIKPFERGMYTHFTLYDGIVISCDSLAMAYDHFSWRSFANTIFCPYDHYTVRYFVHTSIITYDLYPIPFLAYDHFPWRSFANTIFCQYDHYTVRSLSHTFFGIR